MLTSAEMAKDEDILVDARWLDEDGTRNVLGLARVGQEVFGGCRRSQTRRRPKTPPSDRANLAFRRSRQEATTPFL